MTTKLVLRRLAIISLMLALLAIFAACYSGGLAASGAATATQTPATATPTPEPSAPGPIPLSTFAPDDPRRHLPLFLEHTPHYDKLELGNNVVVDYPTCNPNSIIDRWAHTVIYYTLDGSRAANWTIHDTFAEGEGGAVNNSDFFEFDNIVYHSEEGRAALDAVLSDPELMSQILEYSAKPARCPAEFVDIAREQFDSAPAYDKFVIDRDTVAFFESCDTDHDEHVAQVVISHFPTESMIAVTPGEPGFQSIGIGTPGGHELLAALVEDQSLMSQLAALAPRSERCG